MGRVFSLEEVKKRKIPEIESFRVVIEEAKEKLSDDRSVIGAVHYGSTLRGDFSIKSYVDIFVFHNGEGVFFTLEEIVLFAKELFVPVEFVLLDIEMAEKGVHPFNDGLYSSHLRWATEHDGVIKRNPFEILKIKEANPDITLKTFFTIVTGKLEKGICELAWFDGEKKYDFLGKVLEAPIKTAEYVLYQKGKVVFSWLKQEIIKNYLVYVEDRRLIEMFREVIGVDEGYSRALNMILRNRDIDQSDEIKYKQILYWIERNTIPKVMEFVKGNVLKWKLNKKHA
ncbi:nucleotidyltransferase domain-containing protein [Candidatus Parcubacteria bacterium]|nr:nucleotidyltransferase domain-containing protein [Candidatus Parcubacteria bacterium]